MFPVTAAPQMSVLLPVYNGEQFILRSVQSVLSQTFEDFELIIVNDGSRDATIKILAEIKDDRIRIINNSQNMGIVASLNKAMGEARGRYIARMDADDIALPTRFAKQKQFLDGHPEIVVVGTAMSVLEGGRIRLDQTPIETDRMVLRWLLHISNPVGHPSMMFRSEAIEQLGTYLRAEFECAEDFDFSHRALNLGDIGLLPEPLMIYRKHDRNVTTTRLLQVVRATAVVLSDTYAALIGSSCKKEAELVAKHLFGGIAVKEADDFRKLSEFLHKLATAFISSYGLNTGQADLVNEYLSRFWWEGIQTSLRSAHFTGAWQSVLTGHVMSSRPSLARLARSVASGLVPRPRAWQRARSVREEKSTKQIEINGVAFCPTRLLRDDAPTLFVVVDTEAEFDWSKGFNRSQTGVTSVRYQLPAQRIFEAHGLRPIYLVDYAIASQPEGFEPLRAVLQRHGCAIGAHLHPWVNPPFEEVVCAHNSFAGNLSADLEERKLSALVTMIKGSFGVAPLFYKAGRYGIGPNTMEILKKLGFAVDFSILPLTDLRNCAGPDFRFAQAVPYHAKSSGILSIPMTRGQIGLLAPLPPRLHAAAQSRISTGLHLPGILWRTRLAGTVTLTPEGFSVAEQIHLIQTMLARGVRLFVLHYHSPSLSKHTPYVTDDPDLADFIANIEQVCHYFFNTLGGVPGNPADLLPSALRQQVWAS